MGVDKLWVRFLGLLAWSFPVAQPGIREGSLRVLRVGQVMLLSPEREMRIPGERTRRLARVKANVREDTSSC